MKKPHQMQSIDLQAFIHGTPQAQLAIARLVDDVCRSTGFLIISNHAVKQQIIDNAWSQLQSFFELSPQQKLHSKSLQENCPRGYFPPAAESLAGSRGVKTPPDLKESFSCGPLHAPNSISAEQLNADADLDFHYGDNLWPDQPVGFRNAWTDYWQAMEDLSTDILRLLASALSLPQDFFNEFHTDHISALRGIHYPAMTEPPLPEQRAAGEHSDYGSITILKPDPKVAGLEIRLPNGEWSPAPLVEDGFIINIGDMLARWTNDRWVSTMHRVTIPVLTKDKADKGYSHSRQSIAFFHNTNFDSRIECIKTCLEVDAAPRYQPVLAGQYLIDRFNGAALNSQ